MFPVQVTIPLKKDQKKTEVSFYPDVFLGCVPVLTERPDGLYCIENGMVTDNVGLNFSEPDSIIGQNYVYDLSILFLHGPPSSFQVYLIHLVFFFFEHVFLLLQVFLFLYIHLDFSLWHGLRLFLFLLLLLCGFPLSPSLFFFFHFG